MLIDPDETRGVTQVGHGSHCIDTLEGWQHHGQLKGHLVLLVDIAQVVSWVTDILPASTLVVLALVIHFMSRLRISDSSMDLLSPTPPSPRWPM